MAIRAALLVLLIGCRGPLVTHVDASPADTGIVAGDARPDELDGGSSTGDGTAVRRPCTGTFGSALTSTYGRMDGYLVAIVPPGPSGGSCRADNDHLHLQVEITGAVYDVAVNVGTNDATNDVHTTTIDHALVDLLGPAWSEGWHTNVTVDYAALGVHASNLPLRTETQTVNALLAELATVNHISIYATGYSSSDGAHLIHRQPTGHDGMIVTQPLSPMAHARLFSFSTQTF